MDDLKNMKPAEARKVFRENGVHITAGMCHGYAQSNITILPKTYAYDFLLFAQRNPQAIPLLEVGDAGQRKLHHLGNDIDIATDVSMYRIFKDGELAEEVPDIKNIWQEDFVAFAIGCSFSFDILFTQAGIPHRNNEVGLAAPVYRTNIPCQPAGVFSGNLVVCMRPIPANLVATAVTITDKLPKFHGAPVHIGDGEAIGISDLNKPDYADPPNIQHGDIPVYWACGVTPQVLIEKAKPHIAITHKAAHLLITDMKTTEIRQA